MLVEHTIGVEEQRHGEFSADDGFHRVQHPSAGSRPISPIWCIEGTIPPELDGAFFRVQPDPQFPPRLGDDISFNGDGMITRFHFHDGQCDFRQRWAKTDKWKLENAAGKALFGAYRNPLTDDEAVKGEFRGDRQHQRLPVRRQALGAEGRLARRWPWTRRRWKPSGYEKFGGKMTGQTFTAHPKIDPSTGNMVAFGYAASGLCTDDVHLL